MYQRAKNVPDKKPFGTELDVYADGYTFMMHSVAPHPMPSDPVEHLRVTVGGPQCTQPYSLSVLNISAMSFGALGAAAVKAMNTGAKLGRLRARHRRGRAVQAPPRARRRRDLADRHRLLRLPHRRRRLQPRAVPEERRPRPGEDDRDQGVPGRQARARRHPARSQGHRGDRRGPHRAGRQGRLLPHLSQGVLHAARDDGFRRAAARAVRRQAGRVQDLHRQPDRVHVDRQGDDRHRHVSGLHRGRRCRRRHRRGAARVLRLARHAARRGPDRSSRTRSSARGCAHG